MNVGNEIGTHNVQDKVCYVCTRIRTGTRHKREVSNERTHPVLVIIVNANVYSLCCLTGRSYVQERAGRIPNAFAEHYNNVFDNIYIRTEIVNYKSRNRYYPVY